MGTILNGKYLSMPEQVQKNKNDIQIITEYLENIYKCSTALEESSTSINIEYTNIEDKRDFLFAFLLDNKGLLFKIINIIGDNVYLEFYSKLPSVDFNYLGEWVAGNNEYHPNDVVLYNGSLYICENIVLDSSIAPPEDTTNWSLFLGFGDDIGNFIINLYNNRDNIISKEDITPVLLWQNGNQNVGMEELDFTFSKPLIVGKRYALYYKYVYSTQIKQKLEFIYEGNGFLGYLIDCDSSTSTNYIRSRTVQIKSDTTGFFSNCYTNGSIDYDKLVPTEIYELPY